MVRSKTNPGKRPARAAAGLLAIAIQILLGGCYLVKQGTYLVSYNLRTKPIDRLLSDPALNEDTRLLLLTVQDVKAFAVEELGLASGRNYTRYADLDREYLADVVSAAGKLSLEPYLWRYPLFGSMPYKGFFHRADAEKEAARLAAEGFDVLIRKVDGFSTLGFFSDPVFPFMIGYGPYEVANLVIHEEAHATVFLKNRSAFNERLATFIGDAGALLYLEHRFGKESETYRSAVAKIRDEERFVRFIISMHDELDRLYRSDLSDDEKLAKKTEMIERLRSEFIETYDERFETDAYRRFSEMKVNNAYLSLYATYTKNLDLFERFHEALGGDLRRTIAELASLSRYRGDPEAYLETRIRELRGR
jgi:predicted aminopeptidase